jgi:hypothetical protein
MLSKRDAQFGRGRPGDGRSFDTVAAQRAR